MYDSHAQTHSRNAESLVTPGCFRPTNIHFLHSGSCGTLVKIGEKHFKPRSFSLGHHLHRTASRQIAHIALQAQALRTLQGKITKGDTLYPSVHHGEKTGLIPQPIPTVPFLLAAAFSPSLQPQRQPIASELPLWKVCRISWASWFPAAHNLYHP
jgi:hypothetical protein